MSNTSNTLGGEGWPTLFVGNATVFRKFYNAAPADLCSFMPNDAGTRR